MCSALAISVHYFPFGQQLQDLPLPFGQPRGERYDFPRSTSLTTVTISIEADVFSRRSVHDGKSPPFDQRKDRRQTMTPENYVKASLSQSNVVPELGVAVNGEFTKRGQELLQSRACDC